MFRFLGRKKLYNILTSREISPELRLVIKSVIHRHRLDKKDVMEVAYKAIDYWEDLREYDNSTKLEKYFFRNIPGSSAVPEKQHMELEGTFVEEMELDDKKSKKEKKAKLSSLKATPSFRQKLKEAKKKEISHPLPETDDDDEDFFFDDDVVYKGLFSRKKAKGVKDYLIMGEDEYDSKRSKHLYRISFMLGLPVSIALFGMLVFFLQQIRLPLPVHFLWLTPLVIVLGCIFAVFFYYYFEPKELTWTYERVIQLSYVLSIVYISVIAMAFAVNYYLIKDGSVQIAKRYYFKINDFQEFVQKHPDDPEGHMKLAYALMSNDEQKQALDQLRIALRIAPDLGPAVDLHKAIISSYTLNKESVIHFSNGMLYWFIEEDVTALAEFQEALELNPNFAEAHYYTAAIFFNQRRYDKAWKHANAAKKAQHERAELLIRELRNYFSEASS